MTLSKSQAYALRACNRFLSRSKEHVQFDRDRVRKGLPWDIFRTIECGSFATMRSLAKKGLLTEKVLERISDDNGDVMLESLAYRLSADGEAWLAENGATIKDGDVPVRGPRTPRGFMRCEYTAAFENEGR